MPVRRFLVTCALALVLLIVGGTALATAAGPLTIFQDFADNHRIEGRYSPSDLRAALAAAHGDVLYAQFADAVQNVLDRDYLGVSSGGSGGGGSPAAPLLPEPQAPDASGQPPWPLLALTALGGALLITGAGSSIYRRARR